MQHIGYELVCIIYPIYILIYNLWIQVLFPLCSQRGKGGKVKKEAEEEEEEEEEERCLEWREKKDVQE